MCKLIDFSMCGFALLCFNIEQLNLGNSTGNLKSE